MPAPLVIAAAQVAGSWFKKQKDKGNGPFIVGAVAVSMVFSIIVPVVMMTSLIAGLIGGASGDPCQMSNAGFGVNGGTVRVMTWNVCAKSCGNWDSRSKHAAAKIEEYSPDIMAIVEGGHRESHRRYTFAVMKSLGYKNAQQSGPFNGQYIFYKPESFTLLKSGRLKAVWSPGNAYGAAYALLRNNETGMKFMMAETHLDYRSSAAGESARLRSMKDISARLDSINKDDVPMIYAGDFNASQHYRGRNEPFSFLLKKFDDAGDNAIKQVNAKQSSTRQRSAGGKIDTGGWPIDHILVPKGVPVQYYENVTDDDGHGKHGGPYATDHNQVYADIGLGAGSGDGDTPSAYALKDIPTVALDAYQKAAGATGVPWQYIAGIGKIETNHGRYQDRHQKSKADANGDVRPKIRNGIGASGPMQFMPPTWGQYKQDGNFDGTKSVDNIFDAAAGTARMLKRNGAPGNMRSAIFSYNHANWYVDDVLAAAKKYVTTGGSSSSTAQITASTNIAQVSAVTMIRGLAGLRQADPQSSWVRPVKGGFIGTKFGVAGGMWSSGFHTGTDFVVGTGTPVYAAQAGTVSVSHPGWAGNLITIKHGVLDGKQIETSYAHLSSVIKKHGHVEAGELIALSGALGNVTGPHLHFEVHANGKPVNPETYLAGAGTPIAVGDLGAPNAACSDAEDDGDEDLNTPVNGHPNGNVPVSDLCALDAKPSGRLQCDAARSLNDLNTGYEKKFSKNMPITTAYRDLAAQAACKAQNPDCEKPGASRYGFGMVVRFGPPLSKSGSAQYKWMKSVGVSKGWIEKSGAWEFNARSKV